MEKSYIALDLRGETVFLLEKNLGQFSFYGMENNLVRVVVGDKDLFLDLSDIKIIYEFLGEILND